MQENESNIGRGCVAILLNIERAAGLELRKDTASWIFHQLGRVKCLPTWMNGYHNK